MFLFFDTETTGLPRNWNAPISNLTNWPRMVQLAWLLYDSEGNKIKEHNSIIKPQGFIIPNEVARIHGITTERALNEGKDLNDVLVEFNIAAQMADCLVAHNMNFDEKIVGAELLRNNMANILDERKKICTMLQSTEFCGIEGNYGRYKWPKLSELHYKLFNKDFEHAHNAFYDITITAKCFWELRNLGIVRK